MPLAVGVQVTMCTPIPPPRRITCDLMLVLGRSADSHVGWVAPSTSWVALRVRECQRAAGMSVSASWW
jgi:hypothetical protein